jgi:hypothetical protein
MGGEIYSDEDEGDKLQTMNRPKGNPTHRVERGHNISYQSRVII